LGHWKVDEWTEEDNVNIGKIMEKELFRGPLRNVHEVGKLL
jgi:hypothetical protein